ncbi:hypothetical protein Tco_1402414 [Tanacetum coccineum]
MSKKQNCTAMSSAEAEYVALSASCAQVMWMRTQTSIFNPAQTLMTSNLLSEQLLDDGAAYLVLQQKIVLTHSPHSFKIGDIDELQIRTLAVTHTATSEERDHHMAPHTPPTLFPSPPTHPPANKGSIPPSASTRSNGGDGNLSPIQMLNLQSQSI